MTEFIFACSGGGHLKEMVALAKQLDVAPEDQHWATFDNALSRSLLKGRRVTYLDFAAPRDLVATARNTSRALALFARNRDIGAVFSTGSSPAVSFLPIAAARGIPAHYIESAARVTGPSLSGRIVASVPRVNVYTQHRSWANERWHHGGSIFDSYELQITMDPGPIRKAVVSIGTQDNYPFMRLFANLVPLLSDSDVLWQSGSTDLSRFGIDGRRSVPHDELTQAIAEADVVITHAGAGSALTALDSGKMPVLVPRRLHHREHVDDHQVEIATLLAGEGFAMHVDADDLSAGVLREAASRRIVTTVDPSPFRLHRPNRRDRSRSLPEGRRRGS